MTVQPAKGQVDPAALLPWCTLAAVTAWFAAVALRFPSADGDLLWQRWLGERILREHAIPRALGPETFAAAGAPWTPHEWLFSTLLAYSVDRGAAWVVPLLCTLAVAVAFAMVVLRSRRRGISAPLTSAAVLLCALAAIQSFGARAQVLGWAGLAVVVWLLETDGPLAWAAVPATILWANLHASAFLAPAVAALFALAAVLRERGWTPPVRRSSALAAACALATLATPFGLDLARYAGVLLASPMRSVVGEWGATSASSVSFLLGALPLVLLLAAFGSRASLRDRLLALAFAVLLFSAVRNVPVFAFVAAPLAFAGIRGAAVRQVESGRTARAAGWVTVAIVAICGTSLAALCWRDAPAAAELMPIGPARVLIAQARATPRVFCEDFAWCSLFLSEPARFFMDGRCDPYPEPVWREYRDVMRGTRRWAAILDRERIDAMLVRRDGVLGSLLAERPAVWRRIASDRLTDLYVKPALLSANAGLPRGVVADAAPTDQR